MEDSEVVKIRKAIFKLAHGMKAGCINISAGDQNHNPKESECFEGSESDITGRIQIRLRKDPKANLNQINDAH